MIYFIKIQWLSTALSRRWFKKKKKRLKSGACIQALFFIWQRVAFYQWRADGTEEMTKPRAGEGTACQTPSAEECVRRWDKITHLHTKNKNGLSTKCAPSLSVSLFVYKCTNTSRVYFSPGHQPSSDPRRSRKVKPVKLEGKKSSYFKLRVSNLADLSLLSVALLLRKVEYRCFATNALGGLSLWNKAHNTPIKLSEKEWKYIK